MITILEDAIPKGMYCYTFVGNGKTSRCPHWRYLEEYHEQESGYCTYLKKGDADEDGTFILWDQVKEYGVNYNFDNDLILLSDVEE